MSGNSQDGKHVYKSKITLDTINPIRYINPMIALNTEIPKELKRAVKMLAVSLNKTFKQIVIEALQEKLEKENVKKDGWAQFWKINSKKKQAGNDGHGHVPGKEM